MKFEIIFFSPDLRNQPFFSILVRNSEEKHLRLPYVKYDTHEFEVTACSSKLNTHQN